MSRESAEAFRQLAERTPLGRLLAEHQDLIVGADGGHIGLLNGDAGRPVCCCGGLAFTSCDDGGLPLRVVGEKRDGKHVEWAGLFRCDACQLIVNGDTLEIV